MLSLFLFAYWLFVLSSLEKYVYSNLCLLKKWTACLLAELRVLYIFQIVDPYQIFDLHTLLPF